MASYIQVAGKSNLLIGFAHDYDTLHVIGEQLDDTRIEFTNVTHDVPGDSQGGPQGDPIEQQILALRVTANFNLSKWDPAVRDMIIQHGAMAKRGYFSDAEIGALLLRDRSFRFVISPSKANPIPAVNPITAVADPDDGEDYYFYNFPCSTLTAPVATGQGTKFSALSFQFRAWRVPEGHPAEPSGSGESHADGLIFNRDDTGVAAALGLA